MKSVVHLVLPFKLIKITLRIAVLYNNSENNKNLNKKCFPSNNVCKAKLSGGRHTAIFSLGNHKKISLLNLALTRILNLFSLYPRYNKSVLKENNEVKYDINFVF